MLYKLVILSFVISSDLITHIAGQRPWDPKLPLHERYWPRLDNITVRTDRGDVMGFTMEVEGQFLISSFLGLPYANPPTRENRFKAPETDLWHWDRNKVWNATYFRPACPQPVSYLRKRLRNYNETDEDCLYLNIFYPNRTYLPYKDKSFVYPVMVYFHGGHFVRGAAQEYPGFILTQYNVVLVTVSYRLGALGFLSTEDENAKGNYGLMDQYAALEWIKTHISKFKGDRNSITVVGEDAGAVSIGLQMVSPWNVNRPVSERLFHRAILMSGSDMCEWAVVQKTSRWGPKNFAQELARDLGCSTRNTKDMMRCLRLYRDHDEIVNASLLIPRREGAAAGPFAPVVDGEGGFLPKLPLELRQENHFMPIKVLGGVNRGDGAFEAKADLQDVGITDGSGGITLEEHKKILYRYARSRHVYDWEYVPKVLETEYTYWPQPDNDTARLQMVIDMYSDSLYGYGVDWTIKAHARKNTCFFYEFIWRSQYSNFSEWMGVVHGDLIQYLFGYPFLNQTTTNTTGLEMYIKYDEMDKNISTKIMTLWINFAQYGEPTPFDRKTYYEWELIRNATWYHFDLINLTYLEIDDNSTNYKNYRQDHYAFWRTWFPKLVNKWPDATTLGPTPPGRAIYETTTWIMVSVCVILIIIVACLGIAICYKNSKRYGDANTDFDLDKF